MCNRTILRRNGVKVRCQSNTGDSGPMRTDGGNVHFSTLNSSSTSPPGIVAEVFRMGIVEGGLRSVPIEQIIGIQNNCVGLVIPVLVVLGTGVIVGASHHPSCLLTAALCFDSARAARRASSQRCRTRA